MKKKPRHKRKTTIECPSCLLREIIAVVITLAAVAAFYMAALNGVFGISD